MTDNTQATSVLEFRDCKAGLVTFGIIQIVLGIFCVLMVPLMLVGAVMASSHNVGSVAPMNARMMIPGLLFYVALAAWFLWMGVGSIQARRWARALLLVISWFWLISGILGIGFMLFTLPSLYDQVGKNGPMPQHISAVVRYFSIGFAGVFYIIIPGAFVLFYGSRHVKATCERRDPQVRWTDKCPLPDLAVSLMTGLWVVFMPVMGIYDWAVPFFGSILTGARGVAIILAMMVLLGYLALGFYRLNIRAWWCAVMATVLWGVSSGVTFSRVSMMDFYVKMNVPTPQLEMMKRVAGSLDSMMIPFCGLWLAIALAYLFFIRKYFMQHAGGNSCADAAIMVEPVPPPPLPPLSQTGTPSGGLAIASCVLGVLAVLLGIFVIGGIIGILGVILGVIHLTRSRSHRSLAGWGVGLSVIGSLMSVGVVILCFKLFSSLSATSFTPQQRHAGAVKELSDPNTPELNRFYALNQAAKDSLNMGNKEEARRYAEEQSRMLERYKGDWNYGNAVQDVNIVLGRIALMDGKLDEAKDHLLKAGNSPGSPQMNSFGPNMSLAKDLLEKGEKQVVLDYFKSCAKFWKMDAGRLAAWAKEVESGQTPDFGANLVY